MQVWNFFSSKLSLANSVSYDVIANSYSSSINSSFTFDILNNYSILGYTFLASSLSFMVVILDLFYTVMSDSLSSNMLDSIIVAIKFLLLIALLVFIRGGIPRYRFDHLTKMGWIKFLSLVLASILIEMLLIWVF